METLVRFVQAFLTVSLLITLAALSTDTGGGDYFFTLIWLVTMGTVAPYLIAGALMRRLGARWARAVGAATVTFGIIDTTVRTQAFFFPTDRSNGAMALWLPIYALGLIPFFALLAHTIIGVATRK
jgi:hypothetical protein